MRGFLTLDPDPATLAGLLTIQNRLRDALTRQGVHFTESDRLAPTLIAWPYATFEEVEAAELPTLRVNLRLGNLVARPNADRPAEIGYDLLGVEPLQDLLYQRLKTLLDPDPPKSSFVRLARVSPPSRKIGAALHGSGLLGTDAVPFQAINLTFWRQTPTGFEVCRTMPFVHGGS